MTFDPAQVQALIGLGGTFLIIGLVEWVKTTFFELGKRWWPSIAIGFGLLINLGWALVELSTGITAQSPIVVLFVAVIYGLMAGLSASGLYSGAKATRGES